MGELLEIAQLIGEVFTTIRILPGVMKQFASSDFRWGLENVKSDLMLTMHGRVMPMIIERLDDGTDPTYQHFALDVEPAFPQERIDKALYHGDGLTRERAYKVIGYEMGKQAIMGAAPGEERTTIANIDILEGAIILTLVISGHVGQDYKLVSQKIDRNTLHIFKKVPKWAKVQNELRKADNAKRKIDDGKKNETLS